MAALKEVDANAPKGMRLALNRVATALVEKVRPQFPRLTGSAGKSVKAASTRTAARVRMGGSNAPHAPWLDFGGSVGRNKSIKRTFIKGGRYLYPTLERMQPEIETMIQQELDNVAEGAGLEVR